MIKLIVTDLDGTLFYPKRHFKGMINKNKQFLIDYLSKGGDLLLASGRSTAIVPGMEKALNHKVSLLGCNGSFLFEDGEVKNNWPMNKDKIMELCANCFNEYGIVSWFMFDESEHMYVTPTRNTNWFLKVGTPWVSRFAGFYKTNMIISEQKFWERLSTHECYKMMPVFGIGEKQVRKAVEAYLSLTGRYSEYFNIVVSQNAVEITDKRANKGNGVVDYCKEHGIERDEVIVIGDSGNDLEMFSRFRHSFAMASAPKHIRDMASHIIPRVYCIQDYLDHPERMENDTIKSGDYEKALSQLL